MRASSVDRWSWILIYLGLALMAVGVSVWRSDPALGLGIGIPGAVLDVTGIVLIWVRSRMKDAT